MNPEQLLQLLGLVGSGTGGLFPTQTPGQPNRTIDPRADMATSDYTKVPTSNYNPFSAQGQGSNQPVPPNFSQSKGLMAGGQSPQQGILGNINQFMMNPTTALAIGLLQPTKTGSFGEALGGGYQNLMAQNLMNQKLKQQQFANLLGVGQLQAALGKPSNIQYMSDKDGKTYAVGMVGNKMVDLSTRQPIDISNLTKIQSPAATINMASSDPFVKPFLDNFAKINTDITSSGVVNRLVSLDKMRDLLPKMFTGPTSGLDIGFTKFATALDDLAGRVGFKSNLASAEDKDRLAATQDYIRELAQAGLDARALLKGQGTITDQEVAALEKAVQAPQDMNEESIKAILSSLRKVAFAKSYEDRQAVKNALIQAEAMPTEYKTRAKTMIQEKLKSLELPGTLEERYQIWLRGRENL